MIKHKNLQKHDLLWKLLSKKKKVERRKIINRWKEKEKVKSNKNLIKLLKLPKQYIPGVTKEETVNILQIQKLRRESLKNFVNNIYE